MIYNNHFYVPLLLRLSNDVEENPGPRTISDIIDPMFTVHADNNQGNNSLFGLNAGKQCVAMSLCAIVYKEIKSVNIWDRSILNQILFLGNNLYGVISRSINKNYLLLTDVPEFVEMDNHTFHLQYSDSFSGGLFMNANNHPYVTLEHAINETFLTLNYRSCLLTIGMNTVAIIMPFPGVFKVFDSHSRDLYGMPSIFGHCVLISVEGVENLANFFRDTSSATNQNYTIPFELKGVKLIYETPRSDHENTHSVVINNYSQEPTGPCASSERVNEKEKVNQNFNLDRYEKRDIKLQKDREQKREERQAKKRKNTSARRQLIANVESPQDKQVRLEKERELKKASEQIQCSEKREERLAKKRKNTSARRQLIANVESPQDKQVRLEKERELKKASEQIQCSEKREERLAKKRKNTSARRQLIANVESPQDKQVRLEKERQLKKASEQIQCSEKREERLVKKRKNTSARRQLIANVESPQDKQVRLEKERELKKASEQIQCSEKREERLVKKRKNTSARRQLIANVESPQDKQVRLEKERQLKKASEQIQRSEKREERLEKIRKNTSARRQLIRNVESPQDKQVRLQKGRERKKASEKNQSTEEREERLEIARKRNHLKRLKLQKNTLDEKQARLGKPTERIKTISQSSESNTNSTLGLRIDTNSILELVRNFHSSVSTGPLYVCSCCDQLWYKHSVSPADRLRLTNRDICRYLQNKKSVDNIEWLCHTCNNHLKRGKVPPCAIVNGMKFPQKPDFFDLNELECRLIAPRLAFQKIFQAPRGGQLKITGNVVNVPADVNSTVNMLPRLSDDTGTIKVQLKRRLQYKSSALSLNIRPHKVMQAAAWLIG
ncbi:ATP-dependent DNA helicase PIF1 [Paramuricea clavata]|uniref:ATP-dependent DNA helicase PIF1 n=1 Tax=Paramuricea clavata TaxID=317549 RepID=A0A6S7G2E4_PARCT|nr:ATP-dependent DNA helicase PIF1 [Paramuricea clavata]